MTTELTADFDVASLAGTWRDEGYVVVEQFLPSSRVEAVLDACQKVLGCHLEHDPVADRPGTSDDNSIRHLLRPEYLRNDQPEFVVLAELIGDPHLVELLEAMFRDFPVFRDTHVWFDPKEKSFAGQWHRGTQFRYPADEAEQGVMDYTLHQVTRVHIPLLPDSNVQLVPRSHVRWDTPAEYAIRRADNFAHSDADDMPGAVRMQLQPGDVLLFDPCTIHRGQYFPGTPRRTFMITYSTAEVLQTYNSLQTWLDDDRYWAHVPQLYRDYLDRSRRVLVEYEWSRGPDLSYWFP